MLNNQQIEIADFLLKYLESVGGKSSIDDYPHELEKNGFDYFESSYIIDFLIRHARVINNWKTDRWICLTPEGYKAAKIGIKKYFEQIEKDKELDIESKKQNITGIKKANKNSKRALIIAIVVPILISSIQIYFDYRKNSIANRNNNSNIRPDINHSQFPFNMADTLFIKKIKNSLKHDSAFINELKKSITK